MQTQFGDVLIEKRSIDYIPLSERHGKVWHLWPVWFSGDAHLATVATGVVGVAMGGTLIWMAIAVVLGSALGTFFMAFHSTQGPQLGLPQMIQSRPQFGYVGALLVWGAPTYPNCSRDWIICGNPSCGPWVEMEGHEKRAESRSQNDCDRHPNQSPARRDTEDHTVATVAGVRCRKTTETQMPDLAQAL